MGSDFPAVRADARVRAIRRVGTRITEYRVYQILL
jgi:hypothetical protein